MEKAREIIIVDASVVVKWFVDEKYTDHALKIREDYRDGKKDIWSTQLLPFEALNALRYNPEFGLQELRRAAEAMTRYRLALYPILDELKEASLSNALKYGITVYDSSYFSLAELLQRNFYSADEKLLLKLNETKNVHHVKDYAG